MLFLMVKSQYDIHVHIVFGAFGFYQFVISTQKPCFQQKSLARSTVMLQNVNLITKTLRQKKKKKKKKKKIKKKKKKKSDQWILRAMSCTYIYINGAARNFSLYPFNACKLILMSKTVAHSQTKY